MAYWEDMRKLKEIIGNMHSSSIIKDDVLALVEKIHSEVHTKIDIHDVYTHTTEQKLAFEQQINKDLISSCEKYDALLIDIKSYLLGNNQLHHDSAVDDILERIRNTYGSRVINHQRTYLCDLQAENERASKG